MADIKNYQSGTGERLVDTERGREGEGTERAALTPAHCCLWGSEPGAAAAQHRGSEPTPCLAVTWRRRTRKGGREAPEAGIDVYTGLIHAVVKQKLTQHCKASVLQLKNKRINIKVNRK